MTAEQQRELDAWVAENERCLGSTQGQAFVVGYNEGTKAAAEAIRQANWSWEDYQAHLHGGRLADAL